MDTLTPTTEPSAPAPTTPGWRRRQRWPLGAVAGLAAAAAALGVAEAVAALSRTFQSPVLDVGDRVVDAVPRGVKDLAVRWFGTNDKVALLFGIGTILTVYAMVVGVIAFGRHFRAALVGIATFGLIGAWASQTTRRRAPLSAVIPSVAGAVVAVGVLVMLRRAANGPHRAPSSGTANASLARHPTIEERRSLALPRSADPLPPPPAGITAPTPGVSPFFTPNSAFYRIDTALAVPQVPVGSWALKVTGMVGRPLTITYEELLKRRLVEAAVDAGADQVVGRSVDGFTCGFPLAALDGRDALVAVGMNGEALPLPHGFPTRGIEAVEVQIDDGPWATQKQGPIQTADRHEPFPSGATGHHEIVVIAC